MTVAELADMLFVSSAIVLRMIRSIYNKGIAHEEDTHGSFRLFPYRPNWNIDVYNLEMVIRLAYTIDSDNSRKFRQFIMNRLRNMDKVAYVRFASVYKDFTDPQSFADEVSRISDEDPQAAERK